MSSCNNGRRDKDDIASSGWGSYRERGGGEVKQYSCMVVVQGHHMLGGGDLWGGSCILFITVEQMTYYHWIGVGAEGKGGGRR